MKLLVGLTMALAPVKAAACSIALMFSVDASGSINSDEWLLQTEGLAFALEDPDIAQLLVARQARLSVFQWSGGGQQDFTIPWTTITDHSARESFAQSVATLPRRWTDGSTDIAGALSKMPAHFASLRCSRLVIDLSGDGLDNGQGGALEAPRSRLGEAGITLNALAIEPTNPSAHLGYKSLGDYYRNNVIVGDGAFAEQAEGYVDYPRAIRMKLRRELLGPVS